MHRGYSLQQGDAASLQPTKELTGNRALSSSTVEASMKRCAHAFVLVLLFVCGLQGQQAPALPTASPESVGISSQRLERLHAGMQRFVDQHEVGGIVTLVAREGKVVDVHAVGLQDVASKRPMRTDTIFRIASMSKPITSVAVMMLYEEGKLKLADPVSKFIPAFKSQRVVSSAEAGTASFVPVLREITIRDLLTHRSGLTYGFFDEGPVGAAYRSAGVSDGLTVTSGTIAENVDRLAAAPLRSQPGAAWNYGLSTDVLGRLVEVVSGLPLDVFLRDRIFNPLGMIDTSFDVTEAKWSRLATVYSPESTGGIRPMRDPETFGLTVMSPIAYYKAPKKYFSGGAGLTSTILDYARFAAMLLNGGALGNIRLLSPKTIELMTTSHTADLRSEGLLGAEGQFGLGFRISTDLARSETLGSTGAYGWSGIYGTTFWVDPKEHLVAIMMVQRYPGSPVATSFQPLVYQALTRSNYLEGLPTAASAPSRRSTASTSGGPASAQGR
jgi:CubicO group peptidase (beta-lactamase class C family)